jgi:hypothetical protein
MANTYLTPTLIAEEALAQFKNSLNMVGFVDRQLDGTFEAQKAGDTMKVRRRTRYAAVNGPDVTGAIQDTIEGSITVTLDQYKSVPINISSQELTHDIVDFSEQHIQPAMVELAQQVESSLTGLYKEVWNQVGTPGTTPSTISDAMLPKTRLNLAGVPMDNKRSSFYEPVAAGELSAVLGTVFPTSIAELAIEEGTIRRYAGFQWMENQSIVQHTVGAYAGTPLVNGAAQNVAYSTVKDDYKQNLITDGWTATVSELNEGDRFNIADVYEVNPKTRQTTGQLQTFVVRSDITADGSGNKTISISPPIISSGAFQTVDSAPADNAAITVVSGTASTTYPQNIAMHKNAFTLAVAQLADPMGGADVARKSEDGISIRVVMQYQGLTDQNLVRFDILYAAVAQNPGMAVVHVG